MAMIGPRTFRPIVSRLFAVKSQSRSFEACAERAPRGVQGIDARAPVVSPVTSKPAGTITAVVRS